MIDFNKMINDILTEWSFRVHNGQPNINNPNHLIELQRSLYQLGYSDNIIDVLMENLREGKFQARLVKSGRIVNYKSKESMEDAIKDGRAEPLEKGNKEEPKKEKPEKEKSKKQDLSDEPHTGDVAHDLKVDADKEKKKGKIDTAPVKTKIADKYKQEVFTYLGDSNVGEHTKVKETFNKLLEGEKLSKAEEKFLSKWVRVVEPTTGAKNPKYKIYIANQEGHFSRKRKPLATKIPKNPSTGVEAKELHSWLQQNGISTQRTSTFGGKKTTANQTYVNEDGQVKILGSKDKPTASVQRNNPGEPPTSITIGDLVINRLSVDDQTISDSERKSRDRHNRNMDEYAKSIDGGTLDFIDMDDGVAPDSAENRVTVI